MKSKFQVLNLSIQFFHECEKIKMNYNLKNQLIRSASSIALNVSEGNGRLTEKDRKKHFRIAYASAKESQTALILAKVNDDKLFDLCDHISACLYKLCC